MKKLDENQENLERIDLIMKIFDAQKLTYAHDRKRIVKKMTDTVARVIHGNLATIPIEELRRMAPLEEESFIDPIREFYEMVLREVSAAVVKRLMK